MSSNLSHFKISKPWTDKELYGKYELDLFEREYIESLIKPME